MSHILKDTDLSETCQFNLQIGVDLLMLFQWKNGQPCY